MPEEPVSRNPLVSNELVATGLLDSSDPSEIIETIVCSNCGRNALIGTSHNLNDEIICNYCYTASTTNCVACDTKYLTSQLNSSDDGLICYACKTNHYFVCYDCVSVTHNDHLVAVGRRYVCQNCYDDNYIECAYCGSNVHSDGAYGEDNNYCEECYEAQEDTSDDIDCGELKRHPKTHPVVVAKWAKNQKLNTFGIELETQSSFESSDYFTRTSDGSIDGCEYVSYILPVNSEGFKVVKDFTKHAISCNAKIDKECGYHVHLGNYNNTYLNFKKVWLGYTILENEFYSMMSPSRRKNLYCRRFSVDYTASSIGSKNSYARLLSHYYESFVRAKYTVPNDSYNSKRYYYVNLHVWLSRGTVEFRLHSGTMNYQKIINWLQINKKLMDYLTNKKTTVADVMAITPDKLYKILGDDLTKYVKSRHKLYGMSAYSRVKLNRI